MVDRILALGISGLPNPIKCVSWDEIDDGLDVNISDYNVVFIDFSYFTVNKDKTNLIRKCLSTNKFFEVMGAGIDLYIFGTEDIVYRGILQHIYSWLPNIIEIKTKKENGEIINCLNKSFSGYFNLLKNWSFYIEVNENPISIEYPYLYDVKDVAINNVDKKVGFEITNLRQIGNLGLYYFYAPFNDKSFNDSTELLVKKRYEGKLYFLHTLGDNSTSGVFSLLKEIYNLNFSRNQPKWNDKIQTKKSLLINEQINKILVTKEKIELELENIEYFKQLIWQVGSELEDVVHKSLKLIGLLPSSPTKADDDGIFEYQGTEYMLEIKSGLERGAKFTELSKLMARIENRKNIHKTDCKGIFIMNHYANYPPEERDKPFPKNVIDTANVNSVKLITTEELFEIIKPILDGEISPEEAQKQFMN